MYSASDQIHAALMSKRTANAVEEFCSLSEYYTQKQHSHCQNMLAFLKETILFWYNILKDKLSRYYMYFMHSNLYWNITLIFGSYHIISSLHLCTCWISICKPVCDLCQFINWNSFWKLLVYFVLVVTCFGFKGRILIWFGLSGVIQSFCLPVLHTDSFWMISQKGP